MQLFLLGFIVVQICEIFTVGGIPLEDSVRKVSDLYHEEGYAALIFSLTHMYRAFPPSTLPQSLLHAGFS